MGSRSFVKLSSHYLDGQRWAGTASRPTDLTDGLERPPSRRDHASRVSFSAVLSHNPRSIHWHHVRC